MKSNDKKLAEKLERANWLKSEISKLEYFIQTIDVTDRGKHWTKLKVIKIQEVKKTVKVNLFGTREYGIGRHQSEINVPLTILEDIVKFAYKRLREMKDELNRILP